VSTNNDDLKIDASPTKSFFVHIIIKDIALDKAILDLIDNSVDGAKRLRPEGDYSGLSVTIFFDGDKFEIEDTCGGIPLEVAKKYAFKFGRAPGFEETAFSVGQFGVGMKRALFKIGKNFHITSNDFHNQFVVDVDVEKWMSRAEWDFTISALATNEIAESKTGTKIAMSNLHQGVSTFFANESFIRRLKTQIRISQQHFMRKGLEISVNGEALISSQWQLKTGQGIEPSFQKFSDNMGGKHPLMSRIYAGIGDVDRAGAGWYVFCNGRCILNSDQTERTGWKASTEEGIETPKYHHQFARFRGYVFLDCEDASVLPWNTTKTDLDYDHPAYLQLQARMVEAMRPVIDFLNAYDSDLDLEEYDRDVINSVAKSQNTPLDQIVENVVFKYAVPPKKGPTLTSITYKKPKIEVDALKNILGVNSNRAVGEEAFEFALENLSED